MYIEFLILVDTVNCVRLIIQKATSKKMIDLNVGEDLVSAVKIINLDAEISVEKIIVVLIFEIDSNGIYTVMILMNQNTIVLLQIVMLKSEIPYFGTVVFSLVFSLIDIITKEQYP